MLSAGSVEKGDVTCKRQHKTNSNYSSLYYDSAFFPNTLYLKTKTQTMLYIHLKSELLYPKHTQPLAIGRKPHGFSKAGEREIVCILNFSHST